MDVDSVWVWFRDRAREPSTWRGVGGLVVAVGLGSAGSVDAAVSAGVAVVSLVEALRAEK